MVEARAHDLHFTLHGVDSFVTRIGAQKKYLSALNAAQPIVDEVARVAADTLEALNPAHHVQGHPRATRA